MVVFSDDEEETKEERTVPSSKVEERINESKEQEDEKPRLQGRLVDRIVEGGPQEA